MANERQKERELTPTEVARKTLEHKFFQNVLGSNQVRSNPFLYGQLGVQGGEDTYSESMGGEEAQKARKTLYDKAKARGDRLGVYGEPAITNYEVSTDIIEQVEENKRRLSLGDLTEIVKGIASGLKFDVPEELKAYVPGELYSKIHKAQLSGEDVKRQDVLNEHEMDALIVYEGILSQAYNRGVALRASQQGYFADINKVANQISEKYNPKEKGE